MRTAPVSEGRSFAAGGETLSAFPLRRDLALLGVMLSRPSFERATTRRTPSGIGCDASDVARAVVASDVGPVARSDALDEPLVGVGVAPHPAHECISLAGGDDGVEAQTGLAVGDVVALLLHLEPPRLGTLT